MYFLKECSNVHHKEITLWYNLIVESFIALKKINVLDFNVSIWKLFLKRVLQVAFKRFKYTGGIK